MKVEVKDVETLQTAVQEFCAFLQSENVPPERIFDSRLVVNELLGNVLRHANAQAELVSEINDGVIELKIRSANPYFPNEKISCAEVYSEHGRGIFLVQNVCKEEIVIEQDAIKVRIQIIEK